MKIFNTLTRKKEEFIPIDKKEVRLYSCGPTVYYFAHIGNLRAYLFMDNLRRVLKYNGYDLKHVMNITDVGHLVSDADEGEDKMVKAAERENKNPFDIAEFYTKEFLNDIKKLNIDKPEIIAKATEHIKIMEQYVKKIIENGYAYETDNTIYFDTSKLDKYGVLSNINIEELQAGARVDFDPNKKNVSDFAIWIKAPKNHLMQWDTFWGKCYPGWHLECSAMGQYHLGDVFDIHTGGIDHIPVHHENEIAQSKGYSGKVSANYWMHVDFLQVDGGKMSKSLNNLYTLEDLKNKGYDPLVYRMFNFSSHYRNKINFTWDALESAKISLNRLKEGYLKHAEGIEDIEDSLIKVYENRFLEAINDDLNMPVALSIVWEIIKNPVKSKKLKDLLIKFDNILGFNLNDYTGVEENDYSDEIIELINLRNKARENKNWGESDRIRDVLIEKGYKVKDGKDGTILEK
ncbi:MAG TPA: cysteine--tRNA ligase [Clostridia bacterium]|nr:cysteine--tRNA ligase [Clostridia bacterium]